MNFLLKNQQTKRIQFRRVLLSDFKNWLPFFENPITSQYWSATVETPKIECEKWYKKQAYRYQNNLGGMNALIEIKTGKLIGHCGLLVQNVDRITELEIAYSLLPEFWNKGYATESAKKCIDFAFQNNLTSSLISIISVTNIPSEKVALKNEMKIDKRTVYRNNEVNIFRINKEKWKERTLN